MASAVLPWRSGSKKAQRGELKEALSKAEGDVLEMDEVWSFVHKERKRWLWTAMCSTMLPCSSRRSRQIVAFVIGDHSARICAKLWTKLSEGYKRCHCFSDLWDAYATSSPKKLTAASAKGRAKPVTWRVGTIPSGNV